MGSLLWADWVCGLVVQMVSPAGRQAVVELFINLTRWVRTIDVLKLLPHPPPAPLLVPFYRQSPYPGACNNPEQGIALLLPFSYRVHADGAVIGAAACSLCLHTNGQSPLLSRSSLLCPPNNALSGYADVSDDVRITLHNDYVEKVVTVPRNHLQQLVDVYAMLDSLRLPDARCCKRLQVRQGLIFAAHV